MDYHLDTRYDSRPYDCVLVCPPDDIDPDYIQPPRRARYIPDFDYEDDLGSYPSYSSNVGRYQSYTPRYSQDTSPSSYVPDYTSEYLRKYVPPKTSPVSSYSYTPSEEPLFNKYTEDSTKDEHIRPFSNYSVGRSQDKADEVYLDKLSHILSAGACLGVPTEPTNIIANIYVGRSSEAENPDLIKRMRFTDLLNCGATRKVLRRSRGGPHGPDVGIQEYEELYIYDGEAEDLTPHFGKAHHFLDSAMNSSGKVMLYDSGVSRSGAIMISYMMKCGIPLLKSAQTMKIKRRVALCNTGFMKQLVRYARDIDMLDADVDDIRTPKFGGPGDKHRLRTAHLPTFL